MEMNKENKRSTKMFYGHVVRNSVGGVNPSGGPWWCERVGGEGSRNERVWRDLERVGRFAILYVYSFRTCKTARGSIIVRLTHSTRRVRANHYLRTTMTTMTSSSDPTSPFRRTAVADPVSTNAQGDIVKVNDYELAGPIGRGRWCTVVKATARRRSEEGASAVAMKVFSRSVLANTEMPNFVLTERADEGGCGGGGGAGGRSYWNVEDGTLGDRVQRELAIFEKLGCSEHKHIVQLLEVSIRFSSLPAVRG